MLRLLFTANVVLMAGVILWLVATYPGGSDEVEVVEVPAHYTPENAGLGGADISGVVGASSEEFGLETAIDTGLHPSHEKARTAFRRGEISRGIAILEQLRRERPDDVAVLNDIGVYYLSKADTARAQSAFAEAVKKEPTYGRAHFNLGTLHFRAGRLEDAAASFTRALEINPHYNAARYNRALVETALGDSAAAARDYRSITESDRSTTAANAYYNLGVLLARQGHIGEAISALRAELRLRPDHLPGRFNVALLLSRTGQDAQAMEEYRKLLGLDPDHRNAALNLGAILMRDEQWVEAAELFTGFIERRPDDPALSYNLGLCMARMGDDEAASAAFKRAVALDPSYAEAHYNLGLALKRLGDANGAIDHFTEAATLRAAEPTYHYNLAIALGESDRSEEAVAAYRAAIELDPEYFRALYNLAILEYRAEHFESALRELERALELRPESYNATYNLGLTLLKLDRPADAEEALGKAIEFNDTVEANYSLGLALARQDRLDDAVEGYRRALELDPKHLRSIERLGEALSKLGRHERAISRFALLSKLDPSDPSAFNAGLELFRADQYKIALEYFDTATRASGEIRRKSLNMKGAALARLERTGEAVEIYREALVEFPADGTIVRNLARAFAQDGDHETALAELEKLRRATGDDALTLFVIGQQHLALGQEELARDRFRDALDLDPSHEEARKALAELGTS